MKRLLTVGVALAMTAWLGAAPSPSAVADAAMKGDRDAVRALLKQGADVSAAKGDGMTALHFAAERGDAATDRDAGLCRRQRRGGDAHRPVHAAAPRQPHRQRGGRRGAGQGRRQRLREDDHQRRHAAAPRRRVRQRRGRHAAARSRRRRRREGIRVGPDAADVRRRREPRRGDPRAARARRRRDASTTKTIDIAHQSALDRAAGDVQKKVLEASVPKGEQPTPSQVQAAIEASRELFASGKIPPPEPAARRRAAAAAAATRRCERGQQLQPGRDQPAGVEQGRHDRAAARRAAGPSRRGARAARRRRADRSASAPATRPRRC